jgi:cytochrome P450
MTSNKQVIDSYIHGLEKMQNQFGDIFQVWIGSNHYFVFCRPEHAEKMYSERHIFDRADMRLKTFGLIAENSLITLIGPKYKRHAKVIMPMLKKQRFKSQISIIIDCVDQLIQIWKDRDDIICTSIVTDNQQLMLDTFSLLTYDYDLGNLKYLSEIANRRNTETKTEQSELCIAMSIWLNALKRVTINGMPTFLNNYLLKFDKKYQKALAILESYIEKIIQKCQEEINPNARPVNLVASLVSSLQHDEASEKRKPEKEKTGITKKELLGEVLGLILAGFDTSSSVLSWFIYFVSKKPEIQQKMKEELKEHGITKETSLDNFDLVDKCQYIECVMKETLRLAPLVFGTLRTLLNDTNIDGIELRKGDTVTSTFALMQHDPRYWKLDPTRFIPERFFGVDAPDANHNPFVFAPFGGGHRACVGQELARIELKVIIIRYMLFVTFLDAPGNNGGHRQGITIVPKELAVSIKFD